MLDYNPNKLQIKKRWMDILLVLMTMICATGPLSNTVHYLLCPDTPIFLPTLLPIDVAQSPWIYWSYAIFVLLSSYPPWLIILNLLVLWILYFCKSLLKKIQICQKIHFIFYYYYFFYSYINQYIFYSSFSCATCKP